MFQNYQETHKHNSLKIGHTNLIWTNLKTPNYDKLKLGSHCPIITESEGVQLVVQSDKICSDFFGPIKKQPHKI